MMVIPLTLAIGLILALCRQAVGQTSSFSAAASSWVLVANNGVTWPISGTVTFLQVLKSVTPLPPCNLQHCSPLRSGISNFFFFKCPAIHSTARQPF